MIATASKYVNARIGRPSVNAPNPKYLIPGDKVNIKSRVIGDPVNGNYTWYLTEENELFSAEGFPVTAEMKAIPFYDDPENTSILFKDLGIGELWNYTKGEGVTVIVLDSGFSKCPDISSNVLIKSSINDNGEDEIGHGSLMCSIIAGNGVEIFGTAPACSLISIKFKRIEQDNPKTWEDFIAGLQMIQEVINKNEIYIVNCSCAGILSDKIMENEVQKLINYYSNNYKIIFVCAVGNDFEKDIEIIPARLNNVFSVAGLDKEGNRLIASNYWTGINLSCIGDYNSSFFRTKYPNFESNGSSHASAFASGLIALFLSRANQKNKELNYNDIKQLISSSTILTDKTNDKNFYDSILNKEKLLQTFKSI